EGPECPVSEIGAPGVAEQDDYVAVQLVERIRQFQERTVDVGQREAGEAGEAPGVVFDELGGKLVAAPGQGPGRGNAHPVALRCVERVEELVDLFGVDADSRILDGEAYPVVSVASGGHEQLPRTTIDADHGVGGVEEQVEDDLLKLDTVAGDRREIAGEVRPQDHPIPLQLALREGDHLS